jgi:hypothetical protein
MGRFLNTWSDVSGDFAISGPRGATARLFPPRARHGAGLMRRQRGGGGAGPPAGR